MYSGSVGREIDLKQRVASRLNAGGSYCVVSLSKTLYA